MVLVPPSLALSGKGHRMVLVRHNGVVTPVLVFVPCGAHQHQCWCWCHMMMLQVSTHCNTLQHTATHCNMLVLQVRTHEDGGCALAMPYSCGATHCNTLQHTAPHCTTLQHAATHYNTLQHTGCALATGSYLIPLLQYVAVY